MLKCNMNITFLHYFFSPTVDHNIDLYDNAWSQNPVHLCD